MYNQRRFIQNETNTMVNRPPSLNNMTSHRNEHAPATGNILAFKKAKHSC